MKKKIIPDDRPVGKVVRVKDFLPPPDQLVFPNKTKRVTIYLGVSTVDFFKSQAMKNHTKYQRMIRELLDKYAERFHAA